MLAAAFAAYHLHPLAEFGGDRAGEGLDALLDCALDGGALAGGVGDDHAALCEELQDPPDGGAGAVAGDLSSVSAELSEIATVWRRSLTYLPELPLALPVRIQEAASQLAADVRTLEDESPGQPPGLALRVGEQLFALAEDIAAARVMTSGPGIPGLGDARLWASVSADLQRAGSEFIGFILNRVPGTGHTAALPLGRTA